MGPTANLELKVPPAVVALTVGALMWPTPAGMRPLVPMMLRAAVAAALVATAAILIVAAVLAFRRAGTTSPGRH